MMRENSMINKECVKAYLEQHEGPVGLLDLEERINRELRALVAPACEGFTLAAYAHLRPSDAEVRRALLTLLEAVGEDGRRVFCRKSHWLSIMAVFDFVGVCPRRTHRDQTASWAYKAAKQYVERTLALPLPASLSFDCNLLSKKGVSSPFHKPLTAWESYKDRPDMADYWQVAQRLLLLLRQGRE